MNNLSVALANKLDALLSCVCEALTNEGAGPTCSCALYAGEEVAWDTCGMCDDNLCGMGYVRVVDAFQSSTFPLPDDPQDTCPGPLTVQVAVGALRCVPLPDEDGTLPAAEEITESSLALIADMMALFSAALCCDGARVGNWEPLGPQGGCAGGEWTVWIGL